MQSISQPLSIKTRMLNQLRKVFMLPAFEQMLLNRTINKNSENVFAKMIPPNYLYKVNTVRNIVRNGIHYSTDLSDYVEHAIYWGIKDDGHDLLYKHIESGMTIFDVGANIGDTAIHFSKLTGSSGKVYAFEPDPDNYSKLKNNIELNNLSNVTIISEGVGNTESFIKLYKFDKGNKGRNRMFIDKIDDAVFTTVKINSIDSYVSEFKIAKIDFIKIDVEGFEFEVIKGAGKTLNHFHPKLFIEVNESILNVNNCTSTEIFAYLFEKGYKISIAQTGEEITENNSEKLPEHYDIICV